MSSLRSFLYIAWSDNAYRVGITHDPLLDLMFLKQRGYTHLRMLTQALPVGMAYYLWHSVCDVRDKSGRPYIHSSLSGNAPLVRKAAKLWLKNVWEHPVEKVTASITKKLEALCSKSNISLVPPQGIITAAETGRYVLPSRADQEAVLGLLNGRMLFPDEIERASLEAKVGVNSHLENVLQLLFLQGEIEFMPGITMVEEEMVCLRCGQATGIRKTQCLSCGTQQCYYCEECLVTGESRLCRPLFGRPWVGKEASARNVAVNIDLSLTRAQKDAAISLKRFVESSQGDRCLVWAVCGAGKTEITFWAAAAALAAGGRVLYVSPRKDVITEVIPRFAGAFPDISPVVLHGAQQVKFASGQLTFATAHQAIRLYRQFDLVILDEVDAYPYQGSGMLQYAVARAAKLRGKTVYLTATPGPELLRAVEGREVDLVRIPARFHGMPLPVPKMVAEKALTYTTDGQVSIPPSVIELIHRSVEGDLSQLFIFVPSVFLAQRVGEALQAIVEQPPFNDFEREWVQYSHSKDLLREEKRRRFTRGDFPIFVTTTIMERGITVPRANVMVLFCEKERIFDTGTLVQMAGRAGRSAEAPDGHVWFVGAKVTASMKTARQWIEDMNREAFRLGYLQETFYGGKEGGA